MKPQLSIEAFAEFCERKPARQKYDFCDAKNCALAQFLKAADVQNFELATHEIPSAFRWQIQLGSWTFGALAKRLRASQ